jgi:hypothetical protein
LIVLPPPDDLAGQQFGKWAREKAGVRAVEQTEPTHEEKVADGADGGAGRNEQQQRPRDPSDVLREAVLIKRMEHRL